MSDPERYLKALLELKLQHQEEALNPGARDQTSFGYGKACGVAMGLQLAERLWNDQTAQQEQELGSNNRPKR